MLYVFLICYDPTAQASPDDPPSLQPHHAALEKELRAEGVFVEFGGLMPPEYSAPIRVRGGKTTDGPFAETKELLAGYYVIECKDAADAAKQAARIPVESRAWVEARQIGYFRAAPGHIAKLPNVE